MGWRFVKQPNGLLARFSEVVDDFTELDLTISDCLEYCKPLMGTLDANAKIDRALADDIPWGLPRPDGLARYHDALATVKAVHGQETADKRDAVCRKPTG